VVIEVAEHLTQLRMHGSWHGIEGLCVHSRRCRTRGWGGGKERERVRERTLGLLKVIMSS
jgi:hypothetical protein